MGEKIRDLHELRIGDAKLTVELNKAYSKNDSGGGYDIHVQNEHFRYALNVNSFIELASVILRAESEIDFIKNNPDNHKSRTNFPPREPASQETLSAVQRLSKILQEHGADYRLIETGGRYASFIVKDEDYSLYRSAVKREKLKLHHHPYGKFFDYKFLYQMRPFELLSINGIYCEIFFQLPCMSMTSMKWIPLDRMIQSLVWSEYSTDSGVKVISPLCLYIYRLCWAVFKDKGFSEYTRQVLDANKNVLDDARFHDCMRRVFFKFSDELCSLLREGAFDEIIPSRNKFSQY